MSATRLVYSTATPTALALRLATRKPVTYVICSHCRYEKVLGQPCGLPCI